MNHEIDEAKGILPAPTAAEALKPLSVAEAQKRQVCRLCQIDNKPSAGNPLVLDYGKEYAHRLCLDAQVPAPDAVCNVLEELIVLIELLSKCKPHEWTSEDREMRSASLTDARALLAKLRGTS